MKASTVDRIPERFRSVRRAALQVESLVLRLVQTARSGEKMIDLARFDPDWLLDIVIPDMDERIEKWRLDIVPRGGDLTVTKYSALMSEAVGAAWVDRNFADYANAALGDEYALRSNELRQLQQLLLGWSFDDPPSSVRLRRLGEKFSWWALWQERRKARWLLDLSCKHGRIFEIGDPVDARLERAAPLLDAAEAGHHPALARVSSLSIGDAYSYAVVGDIDVQSAVVGGIVYDGASTKSYWAENGFKGFAPPATGGSRWIEAIHSEKVPAGTWPVLTEAVIFLDAPAANGTKSDLDTPSRKWSEVLARKHNGFFGLFAGGRLVANGFQGAALAPSEIPSSIWRRKDLTIDLVSGDLAGADGVIARSVEVAAINATPKQDKAAQKMSPHDLAGAEFDQIAAAAELDLTQARAGRPTHYAWDQAIELVLLDVFKSAGIKSAADFRNRVLDKLPAAARATGGDGGNVPDDKEAARQLRRAAGLMWKAAKRIKIAG